MIPDADVAVLPAVTKDYGTGPDQIFDLARPLYQGMSCSPNHPGFRLTLQRRHGDYLRSDGTSGSSELVVMGGHVGTHMDAFCHASKDGLLFGGVDAFDAQRGGRFSAHGIDTVPPLKGRGVLLDVAAAKGVDILPAGYGVTAADLEETAASQGTAVAGAKFVLVRTGWGLHFDTPAKFLGQGTGVPGITEDAAYWLADYDVLVVGGDTIALEQVPADSGTGHRLMPVHRVLLVERGIHIIEVMDLDGLAVAHAYDFELLVAPLKFRGGTGAPVRPVAWIPASGS